MISSITSGMLIYDKLKQSQELKKLIKDRIYPILPQQKTEYPFLTFTKETGYGIYSKDLLAYDEVTYSFTVWASTYAETCQILEIVRDIFDTYKDRLFLQIQMIDVTEEAADGIFAQSILMKMQIRPTI